VVWIRKTSGEKKQRENDRNTKEINTGRVRWRKNKVSEMKEKEMKHCLHISQHRP
jgi:hypothetical protein